MAPPPSMAAAHDRADSDEPSLRRAPAAEAGAGDSSGCRRENGVPGEARSPPNPQQQQHEMFCYRASAPAHRRVKESPLSSDAIFQRSHAGLLNLCIVVLIAVNSRLIIENLMKCKITGRLATSDVLVDTVAKPASLYQFSRLLHSSTRSYLKESSLMKMCLFLSISLLQHLSSYIQLL